MAKEEGSEDTKKTILSSNPLYELIEQLKANNAWALLNSPLYRNPAQLEFNIETPIAQELLTMAVTTSTGKTPN